RRRLANEHSAAAREWHDYGGRPAARSSSRKPQALRQPRTGPGQLKWPVSRATRACRTPVRRPIPHGAPNSKNPMLTFQQIILTLQDYWDKQGCALLQPYDMEVGAGTSHTATFLRAIGPEPWRAAYVQPSRRPKDGRYGEN